MSAVSDGPLGGDADQITLLVRLVATKPDAKEALRQRVLDDEPIIIKGHPIRVALIRIA